MEQAGGVWNLKELKAANPLAPDEAVKRTPLRWGGHSTVPTEMHEEHDEIMHIMEGEGEFRIGDRVVQVKPGDVVIAPAGTPHGAKSGGLVLLSVFGPGQDPANWDRVQVEA